MGQAGASGKGRGRSRRNRVTCQPGDGGERRVIWRRGGGWFITSWQRYLTSWRGGVFCAPPQQWQSASARSRICPAARPATDPQYPGKPGSCPAEAPAGRSRACCQTPGGCSAQSGVAGSRAGRDRRPWPSRRSCRPGMLQVNRRRDALVVVHEVRDDGILQTV